MDQNKGFLPVLYSRVFALSPFIATIDCVCFCFRQFLDNVIQIPEEFLDYEKLEVWKKLKTRITEEDVRRDIDLIWTRWTRLLLDRENRNSVEIVNPFSPSYTPSVPYDPGTPVTTAGV